MTKEEVGAMLDAANAGNWAGAMGLHIVSASRDEVVAELDVKPIHHQSYGIVHGGVHASVIETIASVGAALDALPHGRSVVGLENHTSFVRAVREGKLRAVATPLTRGRRSQLWEVVIRDEKGALVANGRVRLLVLEPESELAGAKVERTP